MSLVLKRYGFLMILVNFCALVSVSATAGTGQSMQEERPSRLSCKVAFAPEDIVQHFEIKDLNTAKPSLEDNDNIVVAPLMDNLDEKFTEETGVLSISFSNQCDNFYEVRFFHANLQTLKEKGSNTVTGTLAGFGPDSEDISAKKKYTISCQQPES